MYEYDLILTRYMLSVVNPETIWRIISENFSSS